MGTPGAVLPVCVRAARQGHSRHAGHHQEDLHVPQLQDQDVHAGVRSGDPPVTECIIARDTNEKWRHILLVSVPDPHVYGLPDPDPLVRDMDPDPSII